MCKVSEICNNYIWFNWTHKLNWHFFNCQRNDIDGGGDDDDNNSNSIFFLP
jgi:hypothetical protein